MNESAVTLPREPSTAAARPGSLPDSRRRRPPLELMAMMAIAFVLCLTWTVVTPAFQAPDEQSHFAYVQFLGERFKLPGGDPSAPRYSTDHLHAAAAVNADQIPAQPLTRAEWSDGVYDRWHRQAGRDSDADGGGPNPASNYPPLAYLWMSGGYRLSRSGDLFDELFGARLFSALWLPITVLGTWLLAGELMDRRRVLQLTAAAVPALLPMLAFISGSVSPDAMVYATWTLATWLGVRCLRHGLTLRDAVALCAVTGIACVAKPVSYGLLPGVLLVLAVGLWRRRRESVMRVLRDSAAAAAALAVTLGAWILLARSLGRPTSGNAPAGIGAAADTSFRELLSYVWQYYLPRVPGQKPSVGSEIGYPAFHVWIVQGWGAFGWLEVRFSDTVYRVLAALTAGVGAAALVALYRFRRRVDLVVVAFLALTVVALLAGLHWSDYHLLKSGSRFMQGRYLFPIVGLMGCALAAAVSLLPPRARPSGAAAAIGGLLVFHLISIGLALERFYA